MISSFTSGQAEWRCKQRPVGAANLRCKTFVYPSSEEKRKHKESSLPEANVDDWPEVTNAEWKGGAWCWLPIGAVRTVPEDAELEEVEELPNASLPEGTAEPWACNACTYMNRNNLNVCAMCETGKAEHAEQSVGEYVQVQNMQSSDDWPSLQEAYEGYENCELSSVASSWLDVDVGGLFEESDMLVVAPAPLPEKKGAISTSWAALAKQNLGAPAAGRAAGCTEPPIKAIASLQEPTAMAFGKAETERVMHATRLSQRQSDKLLRKHNGSPEAAINAYLEVHADSADPCLMELEERRMLGRGHKPKPSKKR